MFTRHLRHNAVAYLALVVALSTGTSYAAVKLANGSVTTKKLANNAVTGPKIKDGQVAGADLAASSVAGSTVADGSIGAADLAAGSVAGTTVADGSIGAADLAPGLLPAQVRLSMSSGLNVPPAAPDQPDITSFVVSVPSAGTLHLRLVVNRIGLDCASGAGTMALYRNNVGIPATAVMLPSFAGASSRESSALVQVAAGSHTLSAAVDCSFGAPSFGSWTDSIWTTLFIPS